MALPTFLISPWIPLAILILLAFHSRLMARSWLAPSAFPILVWVGFISAALLYCAGFSSICDRRLGYFNARIGISHRRFTHREALVAPGPAESDGECSINNWLACIAVFSLLPTLATVLFPSTSLSQNDTPFSFASLLALGHQASVARYLGVREPALVRLLWTWVFPAAALGGITFPLSNNRSKRLICLAAFVPAFAYSFLETTRGGFVITTCCWLGGFFASKILLTAGSYSLFNRRTIMATVLISVIIYLAFVVFDSVRVFTPEKDFVVDVDSSRVKAYFVGSLTFLETGWIVNRARHP